MDETLEASGRSALALLRSTWLQGEKLRAFLSTPCLRANFPTRCDGMRSQTWRNTLNFDFGWDCRGFRVLFFISSAEWQRKPRSPSHFYSHFLRNSESELSTTGCLCMVFHISHLHHGGLSPPEKPDFSWRTIESTGWRRIVASICKSTTPFRLTSSPAGFRMQRPVNSGEQSRPGKLGEKRKSQ